MVDQGAGALSLPKDWPDHPDPILALNQMGSFDWDLDTGLFHMDAMAHEILDVRLDEYDGRPETLSARIPPTEFRRLDALVCSGPDDVRDLADLLIDVAILLLRRGCLYQRSGGRLQQHVEPGDPDALTEARRAIRAAVRAWGVGERPSEIELVAKELITNVLMHTEGSATVTLRIVTGHDRRLRVEVEDISSALPRRREASEACVSGRGLLLVDRLTDAWGVEPRGYGKVVWCEFLVPRRG
jgi:anti-sigma regulatory factor (Ser/Thr protein kinase)